MRGEADRRNLDRALETKVRRERARAVEREGATRLLDDLSRFGPEAEGLMALVLRGMEAEGWLDGPALLGLYGRALLTMGVEAANRVFLGEGVATPDVDGAIREILDEEDGRAEETERQAGDMAQRLGLDPGDIEVRLGEEGGRRAGAVGAAGVEQGKVIYLDDRRADPQTREGREVLADEVAHVAQVEKGRVAAGTEAAEAEASRLGEALSAGAPVESPAVALQPQARAAHTPKKNQDVQEISEESVNKGLEVDYLKSVYHYDRDGRDIYYLCVGFQGVRMTLSISAHIPAGVIARYSSHERKDSQDRQIERKRKDLGKKYSRWDDVGHFLASSLGGDDGWFNFAPQRAKANRHGPWREMEQECEAIGSKQDLNIARKITWRKNAQSKTWRPSKVHVSCNGKERDIEWDATKRNNP